ncbi:MAG: TolC family protein, partial [Candidatus Binatia bacterium]
EPIPPYTLSDLIRLALERNPGIAAAKRGIEVATRGIEEAKGERLPVITFASGYLYAPAERKRLIPRSQLSGLNRRGKVFNEQIVDLGAVLTIPVYTGGRITANIELNRLNEVLSRHRLDQTRDDLILNISSAYYNIVKLGKVVQATEASRKSLLESQRVVDARVKAQKAVPADLFKVNTRLAAVEQNLIVAQNGVDLVHAALNTLLGVEAPRKKLVLKEELPRRIEPLDLKRDIDLALERRPEYQIAKRRVEIQQRRFEIEESKRWPQVLVRGNVLGTGGDRDFFPMTDDETIGLRVTLPIFDEPLRARIAKERANLFERNERLRQQRLKTVFEVEKAHLNVIEAENRIKLAEAVRTEAAEALRIEQVKFEAGKSTVEFLLDAQAAQLQAEVNFFQALSDFNIQKLVLKKSVGLIEMSGP